MLLGGTLVFPRGRFDPTEVLDLMESEGVHRWGGVPTMVGRVLNDPTIEGRYLSSVRAISLGGSPVPPELVTRIKARFPSVERGVSQVYGLSEGGGTLTAASGRDLVERPGTAGRPLPLVELRIDRPDEKGTGGMSEGQERQVWSAPKCVELTTRRTLGGASANSFELVITGAASCYDLTPTGTS